MLRHTQRSHPLFFELIMLLFLLSSIGLTGCKPKLKMPLSYEGSSTIGENIMPRAVKHFEQRTGIKFTDVSNNGSGSGFRYTLKRHVDIGGMSRAMTAKERASGVYFKVIGYDALVVFLHKNLPIQGLSKQQLRAIFGGQIKNWSKVGGPDAPITVVTEELSGTRATVQVFKEEIMGQTPLRPDKQFDRPGDCVSYIENHPYAITHGAYAFKRPALKAIAIDGVFPTHEHVKNGKYPLVRPLLLLSAQTPTGSIKAFFDFILSPAGQRIVSKKFIPAR